MTELKPDVADDIPWSDNITPYDEQHFVTYLRLLDAAELDLSNRVFESRSLRQDAQAGQSLRSPIRLLKPRNPAIFGDRLFTSSGRERRENPLQMPVFSKAVHRGSSVPV